ncbi:hypothetical protein J2T17_004354 [Paenibacillus mucilaginosus]|uniref:hypothetical protein n=1 Tax=Paenibacillus mucilaginosus TaxID=61624 RepID=UPI003D1AF89F
MDPNYATLAIMGDAKRSGRKDIVQKIASNIHRHDDQAVLWITSEVPEDVLGTIHDDSIPWIEAQPDLPEDMDPAHYFRNRRNLILNTYLNLVAKARGGFSLGDVVPEYSYRRHMEGPSYGYMRFLEAHPDKEKARILMEALEQAQSVTWLLTPQGRRLIIPKDASTYEKAAIMVLGIWNFWAQICRIENAQQFLVIIEPDKDMMMGEHDSELKVFIENALNVCREMSEEITMSLLLSTETVFPVPELYIRTRVFMELAKSDLDMFTEDSRNFFGQELYEEWDKGNRYAAFIIDQKSGESCLGDMAPKEIEFIESEAAGQYDDGAVRRPMVVE